MTSTFDNTITKLKNALESVYFKKSDIATNLTTDNDSKVLSAKQGKVLQDNKIDKTSIVTNLTTDDDTKVLSAKQGKLLNDGKAALNTPIEFIVGTQTASTATWTGVSTKISTLTAGTCILYKLPYASANANVTLDLTLTGGNTTGAKAVFFVNTTRVKQQYAVNAILCLMYDGTYWRVVNPYTNTDKNDNYYDRNRFSNTGVWIKEAFTEDYGFIVGDANGYERMKAGSVFDLDYPILVYNATANMAVDTRTTNGYSNLNSMNLTYVKSGIELTLDDMVYLVGTVNNNKFTVDSSLITQNPNSTGKVYLPLGFALTTTTIVFFPIYNLVTYNGSELVPYVPPHSHSEYVNPVIVDNVITNDANKVLSAKQGKELNDAITILQNELLNLEEDLLG